MPKRNRSGLSLVTAPGRRVQRTFRKRVSRRKYLSSKRGPVRPNYLFHRWITALPAANVVTSACAYSSSTSILDCNVATADYGSFSCYFTMADLPNLLEFSTLFDQYKLNRVVLQMKLINVPDNSTFANSNAANFGNFYPTVWYTPDEDDNTSTTLAAMKEFSKVKHRVLRPNRELNIVLRPRVLNQLYRSAVTTGYGTGKPTYVDMAQTDVPHYGFKCVVDFEGLTNGALSATQFVKIKLNFKYYFSCKNVR